MKLLFLLLFCVSAHAELNPFLIQPRGETFTFSATQVSAEGERLLSVQGPWESFLEAVSPQHSRQEVNIFGYVSLYEQDDWSVVFDGHTLVLTAPEEVRPDPYYSPLVVKLVPGIATHVASLGTVAAVPEPSTNALLLLGVAVIANRLRSLPRKQLTKST